MKKMNIFVVVAMVGLMTDMVAASQSAAELAVVDPGDATVYLSDGASSSEQAFKGDLVKQGPGTNSLSNADMLVANGRIVVADGNLVVGGAASSGEPAKPLDVLTNAAVWLDASLPSTVELVDGSTSNVLQWLDVRETGNGTSSNPYAYLRAVAYTNLGHSATYAPDPEGWFPVYVPAADGENAYVDFGQYSSGRTMRFRDSSGNVKRVGSLRHAFVVLGTHDGHYGFVFDPGSGNPIYVPQNYWNLVNCTMYHFIQSTSGWTVLLSGVFRVDGVAVDPVKDAKPNGGYQLLDIVAGKDDWMPQGFFSHANVANSEDGYRQGGGRLCEVILFTSPLEERDRLRVEAYLRNKWTGVAAALPSYAASTNGALELAVGGVVDMADPVALTVTSGATYNATTAGVECVSASGTSLVKTGDGEMVVKEVPAGLEQIDVQAGTLRLRQCADTLSIPTNLCGYIEDPSFEAFSGQNIGKASAGYNLSTATHGWSHVGSDNTYIARLNDTGTGSHYFNPVGKTFPDGDYVGVLHLRGGLATTVTLPADGIYRLSYWVAERPNYKGHEHLVKIDDHEIAQVKAWDGSYAYHLVSFRTPWLSAGEHTLALYGDENDNKDTRTASVSITDTVTTSGNLVALVDDFHLDWVESGEEYVAVSNASFEVSSFCAAGYEQNPVGLAGWEYVSTNDSDYVFLDQTWNNQPRLHPASDGCRILNLYGRVQIGQTVTFPTAGTYTLTCAAGSTASVASTKGRLSFSLGGVEIGTLTPTDVMKVYLFTFTVPEDNYSAKLVIAGQVDGSVVSLDDVRIALKSTSSTVLVNSFAEDGWSTNVVESDIYDGSGKVEWLSSTDTTPWGAVTYDDVCRVGIRNKASVWRTVSFPSAGTYRLAVASIGRFYRWNNVHLTNPGILTRYNGNEFDAWVAKGGVTNVVGRFGVDDRERFVTHRFVFELPEGGDWDVGFSGLKESVQKVEGNSTYHSCGGVLDGLEIEQVTPMQMPTLPKAVSIDVADGATLALDYVGTNEVSFVRYAGRSCIGEIDATTCPDFVTGVGSLFVRPKGTIILFR